MAGSSCRLPAFHLLLPATDNRAPPFYIKDSGDQALDVGGVYLS